MNVRHLAHRVPGSTPVSPTAPPQTGAPSRAGAPSFADALARARQPQATPEVRLSAHAAQRIAQRGISMSEAEQQAIHEAMTLLDGKGARDALLLRSDAAFVVNVPNRTVVTAMGTSDLAQRAFTGIDSAMVL